MSREIKFRVWDSQRKRMYGCRSIHWENDGKMTFLKGSGIKMDESLGDVLIQFTGLKDKNGKEDYVGNVWEVEYRGKKHRFVREATLDWTGYIFDFKCITGSVSPVHANVDEEGIIIDNIHSNPELLGEQK